MTRDDGRRQNGMKRLVGLVLLVLGISLLLLSLVNFTRTHTVIDTTFSLESGEKYGPRHYFPPKDCVLKGKVSVEGEGINLTFGPSGYSFENVFVDSYFNFTIDPAYGWDIAYFFTFDNTDGDAESHLEFVLEETLTEPPIQGFLRSWRLPPTLWMFSLFGSFLLLIIGFSLILGGLIQGRRKRTV
jgi:hypothetical protein